MAKRDQARAESAFLRGETGVDGQATEDTRDEAEVEAGKAREAFLRGKAYLGREFLTWLLWRSESGEPVVHMDEQPVTVVFAEKLILRGIQGKVVEEMVRGSMAPYSPLVRRALDRGLLVHTARIRLTHGERQFACSLDAEHFDVKSGKLPELLSEEEDDARQERLVLAEQLSLLVQALLEHFLTLRASKRWAKEVVPELRAWMAQP